MPRFADCEIFKEPACSNSVLEYERTNGVYLTDVWDDIRELTSQSAHGLRIDNQLPAEPSFVRSLNETGCAIPSFIVYGILDRFTWEVFDLFNN